MHIEAYIIQLPHTNNIRLEFGNVIDTREGSMLAILASEDDRATTLNPHHQYLILRDLPRQVP
jgi:hypothetical protein